MTERPIDETRQTSDGPIRILVGPDGDKWTAAIRGPEIEALRRFGSVAEANAWAHDSFRAMFPDSPPPAKMPVSKARP
jgi:hypothetical protein